MNENNKTPRVVEIDIIEDYRAILKWLFRLLVFVLILWAATIGLFVWYLNQYDFVSYTQDGDGYNNINNRVQGDVINGAESESENPQGEGEGDSRP